MLLRHLPGGLLLNVCVAAAALGQDAEPAPFASHYVPRPLPIAAAETPAAPERSPFPVRLAAAAASSPDSGNASLPLAPRSERKEAAGVATAASNPREMLRTIAGSLGLVVGVFFVLVWVSRRLTPTSSLPLPKEVVELLGKAPLAGRQQMQLVRIGNRLVLVATTTTDCRTLTEIRDPAEVEHLTALCRRGRPGSSTAAFNQVMQQLSSEGVRGGYSGGTRPGLRGAS